MLPFYESHDILDQLSSQTVACVFAFYGIAVVLLAWDYLVYETLNIQLLGFPLPIMKSVTLWGLCATSASVADTQLYFGTVLFW